MGLMWQGVAMKRTIEVFSEDFSVKTPGCCRKRGGQEATMTEPQRCKNCVYWGTKDREGARMCLYLGSEVDDGAWNCRFYGTISTGPEFCCIHWTAKEGNDDD